mmetsp:Transcript_142686/g.443773  ORF Transcript_142686/g.443773 Transcript_142686/m.443773 type:complete len:201 (+) Transcript_142686:789-1391(+)
MDLGETRPLDEVVDLADGRGPRKLGYQGVQVVLLLLEELAQVLILERLVPEGSDVDPGHLRRVDDLAERPHQGAVRPHELLRRHAVCLVEDDVDLVVVAPRRQDHAPELVGDVQLGHVEEEEDHVHPVREPLHDGLELVPPLQALLLARQHARGVYQRDALEHGAGQPRALEPAEERVPEVAQLRERQRVVHDEGVPRSG